VDCLRESSEFAFAKVHFKAVAAPLRCGLVGMVYPERKYLNPFGETFPLARAVVRLL
jgi:hypothetical protein